MKKYVNGEYIDMTTEEIAAIEDIAAREAAEEKHRPLSLTEVQEMMVRQQINTLTVDDATALRMIAYYPEWTTGTAYKAGDKLVYNGDLYRVLQAHTSQETWLPGTGTESLYTEICETHAGTLEDPIPYSGNMALENGKYYYQDYAIYLCTRDTVNPVYNHLPDLVGLYVENV